MSWNYRFVQVGDTVGIYEVYYEGDKPVSRTEDPVSLQGETEVSIRDDLEQLSEDLQKHPEVLEDSIFGPPVCEMCHRPFDLDRTENGFTPEQERQILEDFAEVESCSHVWECRKCKAVQGNDIMTMLEDIVTGKV